MQVLYRFNAMTCCNPDYAPDLGAIWFSNQGYWLSHTIDADTAALHGTVSSSLLRTFKATRTLHHLPSKTLAMFIVQIQTTHRGNPKDEARSSRPNQSRTQIQHPTT